MTQAHEILEQLGGRKFLAMTGSKNLAYDNGGRTLQMHLTRNNAKAKYLRITLEANDTYTMVFSKPTGMYGMDLQEVAKYEGVYNDMLQTLFTKVTGLQTTL